MEFAATQQPTAPSEPSRGAKVGSARPARSARETRGRGRARSEAEARARTSRARRPTPERTSSADLDTLYLNEMASSSVLAPAQEIELGRRIVSAERAVIEALVSAPSGAEELGVIGEELARGEADLRQVILNPDQNALDLPAVRERATTTLQAASAAVHDEALRADVADRLSAIRLDTAVIERAISAIKSAIDLHGDAQDQAALLGVERAKRELKRAKEGLVVGNLRLVVLFARKYLGRGVPLLDLVQEGNLGLMRAADKYDYRRGFRFSTYAAWWIKQALQRALLDRALRLPVHVADDRRRVGKMRASFLAQHRREPTVDEIAHACGLSRDRVVTLLNLPARPASLDAPIGEQGEAKLEDFIPGSGPIPEDEVALHALGAQLEGLLHALSPREEQVVRMRFGIGHGREHTLEEVGRELSLTRERIRQIERTALDKLRSRSERVELSSYLER